MKGDALNAAGVPHLKIEMAILGVNFNAIKNQSVAF